MFTLKNTIITAIITAVVTAIVVVVFQTPLANFVNNLFSNNPRLEATLAHDGYIKSIEVQEELSGTKYRVYPISLELTNTGTIPLTIKSVIPYMIDTNNPNNPRIDLLYKQTQEKFPEGTIKVDESVKVSSRAYIRHSIFAAGSTYPKGHKLIVETEVKILGRNKISKLANVRSLELTADGNEVPNPKNEIPVDFKEENPNAIWWK
jgi:hypothetical protein